MKLKFDVNDVVSVEFGVGRDENGEQVFLLIPADAEVQRTLRQMVDTTLDSLKAQEHAPARYDAGEKHAATEYLFVPLDDDLATPLRHLHDAAQLRTNSNALDAPEAIFCYFARLVDSKGRRVTGLRRAAQFKGILKSKNRLLKLLDDTLEIVDDRIFKLDVDFDLLIDESNIHILRPSAFEFAGRVQQAVLDAVADNVNVLTGELPYVDFGGIGSYASKHPRAARYLASICSNGNNKNIDKTLLARLCKQTGVKVATVDGKLHVSEGHELPFLEVLDRRRYEITLVQSSPELYRASSRTKLGS